MPTNTKGLYINFTPDPSDNAGWFTDPPDTANARTIRDYIDNASCPPLTISAISSTFKMATTPAASRTCRIKLNATGGNWVVCLPVVNTDRFNQDTPIANFVSFQITQVEDIWKSKGVTGGRDRV